jgi:hypothetical protein
MKQTKVLGDLKILMRITNCDNLQDCILDYKKLYQLITNATSNKGQPYSINSIKGFIQAIVYSIDHLDFNTPDKVRDFYKDKLDEYKIRSALETKEKKENETILGWNEYLQKVKDTFGTESKEFLISKLYKDVPVRDDLHLKIVENDLYEEEDTNNYLVIKNNKMVIIIKEFKTNNKYDTIKFLLSNDLMKLIQSYMNKNNKTFGDYLFTSNKNTKWVSEMNKKMGLKGSINLFRKMTISELKNASAEDILKLNKKMAHSYQSSLNYVRNIKQYQE